MATGMGLNMRRPAGRSGYGAIEPAPRAFPRAGAASRSSRRCSTGSVSGHQTRHAGRQDSRQRTNSNGPRQSTRRPGIGSPSMRHDAVSDGATSCREGREPSRLIRSPPHSAAKTATGIATDRGRSDAMSDRTAPVLSRSSAVISQREGRHSSRHGADVLDQACEFGIGRRVVPHEPVPQPIVFSFQQP